jgi:starch synthase
MRLLLATSELHPYSKTGGLADMTAALAKSLAKEGHRVGVVTPLYRGIRQKQPELRWFDWQMELPLGAKRVSAEVWTLEPAPNLTLYFIRHDGFFDRPGLYNERSHDYADNAERFLFLSKAAVHLARYLPWQPEIVHTHDWQTGMVPLLIRHQQEREGWWNAPRTCVTIHNLAYQGIFARSEYVLANLPLDYFHPEGCEFLGWLNFLKAGLAFADRITTVSPRYAREITTEAYGCGLDGLLRRRQRDLTGILNGVDYEEWSPTGNPFLPHAFTADDLRGKAANKLALLHEFGLPAHTDRPLFGNITRLADQKGVDIQLAALQEMLAADMQFVLLGSGSAELEAAYRKLEARFPEKVAVRIGFDLGLSHRIEAGCDFFLMPSRFEPCGLNQMYSQRYGTIPIVRRTGGLDDSVVDIADDPEAATGIKFDAYSARALAKAIRKALVLYATPRLLHGMRRRGMETDFSWSHTAGIYVDFYKELLGVRG